MSAEPGEFPFLLIRAGSAVVSQVQAGVESRGFTDIRPAHGFAFSRVAQGDCTVKDLAAHLGVTKQSASVMVDDLVAKGYLEKRPRPSDRRSVLLALTRRGLDATAAATAAAAVIQHDWTDRLGSERIALLVSDLAKVADGAAEGLRPAW